MNKENFYLNTLEIQLTNEIYNNYLLDLYCAKLRNKLYYIIIIYLSTEQSLYLWAEITLTTRVNFNFPTHNRVGNGETFAVDKFILNKATLYILYENGQIILIVHLFFT